MNSFVKLLPRLRRRKHRRFSSSAAKGPVKQLQNTILDRILDISKEARDAIAANEQQEIPPFEIAFPPGPDSPTPSHSGSYRSVTEREEVNAPQTISSLASSLAPSPLPLLAPPIGESLPLRDVPASGLGRRRNFKGGSIHTIPIPPMPTTPPPSPPPKTASSTRSLRRQPRYTDLKTASPISRCRTFPLSKDRTPPPSVRNSVLLVRGPMARRAAQDAEEENGMSTTPAGSPTALTFPLPPRTTFTKRTSALFGAPNSATREGFPINQTVGGVRPLSIVKRISVVTTHESVPESPSTVGSPVMDELFACLDDAYAQYNDAEDTSMVSISLSDSDYDSAREDDDFIEDLDGEVVWRTTYSLADEYAAFFPQTHFPPVHFPVSEETRPCPYSFLVERTQTLSKYHAEGSRSLPDLALRRSLDLVRRGADRVF
ncbi:hypothetical protein B0H12DRAFT_1242216 [Mycena haematopus]|nr:hypothetical protein B0H12DRAFT_1242216 [Mycena haematopus]